MGLQKYRADKAGEEQRNGGVPYFSKWIGGSSLALIRKCPVENANLSPRTVYALGEPDTFFSIPAACNFRGQTIRGFITIDDNGEYVFRAYRGQLT